MRITINQANIEEAITNWVFDQLVDNEGKEVRIEMAATRGTGGFTGTVTVYNEGEAPEEPVKKKTAAKPVSKDPLGIKVKSGRGRPRKTVEASPVHVEESTEETVVDAMTVAEDEIQENLPLDPVAEPEPVKENTAPTTTEERPSLFGDLTKPVN